jgi:hypothetical protein
MCVHAVAKPATISEKLEASSPETSRVVGEVECDNATIVEARRVGVPKIYERMRLHGSWYQFRVPLDMECVVWPKSIVAHGCYGYNNSVGGNVTRALPLPLPLEHTKRSTAPFALVGDRCARMHSEPAPQQTRSVGSSPFQILCLSIRKSWLELFHSGDLRKVLWQPWMR